MGLGVLRLVLHLRLLARRILQLAWPSGRETTRILNLLTMTIQRLALRSTSKTLLLILRQSLILVHILPASTKAIQIQAADYDILTADITISVFLLHLLLRRKLQRRVTAAQDDQLLAMKLCRVFYAVVQRFIGVVVDVRHADRPRLE